MTSEGLFPLFKEAEGHLLKARGTAAQKAEFFESLLTQVHKKTGGSFNFTLTQSKSGHFVFAGEAGPMRVIDSSGSIFKGNLKTGGIDFVTNEPNFNNLTSIP